MNTPATVRLCELSSKLEQDWRDVYTTAFPAAEQEPETRLQNLIDTGRLLYHKTVGKQGEMLCFSMVSLAPEFSFLAYIATDPKQRSGGYGSKHMRALIDLLKQKYPNHIGLFLEIESTKPRQSKLSEEEKTVRNRRLSFYRRLGFKRLCRSMHYAPPGRNGEGEHELDILFCKFDAKQLDHKEKSKIVSEILTRFYELAPEHKAVTTAVAKTGSCTHAKCEEEEVTEPSTTVPAPAAPVAATEQAAIAEPESISPSKSNAE